MTENVLSGIKETVAPQPVKIVGVLTPEIQKLAERLKSANAQAAAGKKEQEMIKEALMRELEQFVLAGQTPISSLPLGSQINIPNGILFEIGQQVRLDQSTLKSEEPTLFERFSGPVRVLKFKPLV